MSGDVMNLRRARKARARHTAEQAAAENRARFGASKEERERTKTEAARTERAVDRGWGGTDVETPLC